MAIKRITDGSGSVALELSADEYAAVRRALAKALARARELDATADEADLVRLLSVLEPGVRRADTGFILHGAPGWKHARYERQGEGDDDG